MADNTSDVIYSAVIAIKYKLTVADLTNTLAPYLTMAEGLRLAAQTFSRDGAQAYLLRRVIEDHTWPARRGRIETCQTEARRREGRYRRCD